MNKPDEWYTRQVQGDLYVEIMRQPRLGAAIDRLGGGRVMVSPDELPQLIETLARVFEDIGTEIAGDSIGDL